MPQEVREKPKPDIVEDQSFTSMPIDSNSHADLDELLREAVAGPNSLPAGRGRTCRWGLFRSTAGGLTLVGLSGKEAVIAGKINSVVSDALVGAGLFLQWHCIQINWNTSSD